MRAAVLTRHGGPEALEVRDVPRPAPGPGEVVVRVGAAALNNTDIWTREGAYGLTGDPDARAGWRGPLDFPRIQGGDIAGTIVETGQGVDPARCDGRVLVDPALYDGDGPDASPVGLLGSERDGGFAEYVAVAADRAHPVDDSPLTDAELACLPVAYGTALGMLERGQVGSGETVLVTGASGGVGLALVQMAAARLARVVAVTTADKADRVVDAGAAVAVDRTRGAVLEDVRAASSGALDAVLDVVAGGMVGAGLALLRDGGRWVVAGALAGHTVELDLRRLYLHNIALVGSSMHTPAHFDLLVRAARRGDVRPVVAATHPLAEIHAAQREFTGRDHVGKIVVVPASDPAS